MDSFLGSGISVADLFGVEENDTACWKAARGEILPAFRLLESITLTPW